MRVQVFRKNKTEVVWWCTALRSKRPADLHEFEVSLVYIISSKPARDTL